MQIIRCIYKKTLSDFYFVVISGGNFRIRDGQSNIVSENQYMSLEAQC